MTESQNNRPKMCSQLWTANLLTLVQLLLLLFVGSCFSITSVTPSNKAIQSIHLSNHSSVTTVTDISSTTSTLSTAVSTSKSAPALDTVDISTPTPTLKEVTLITKLKLKTTATPSQTTQPEKATTKPVVKMLSKNNNLAPSAHGATKIQEKLTVVDCELPILPKESRLWRGNETHELNLPITMTEDCLTPGGGGGQTTGAAEEECPPVIVSWEGSADIQSGDILIVRIANTPFLETSTEAFIAAGKSEGNSSLEHDNGQRSHRAPPEPAVYQVTRQGHEHCDVTDGMLLDIAPLSENDVKLFTLYDKDLTEGVNLLIVASKSWGSRCVRLKVTVKSDNCGDSQDCSGKGVCYTNISMEGYECQCCPGYMGPHCDEQDACGPPPCLNNGICVPLSQTINGANYQCLCPYGYTGKHCETESNPCRSSPCYNGGSCFGAQNSSTYQCACAKGWAGARCDKPRSGGACSSQPCVNGICMEQTEADMKLGADEYKCFCQPGYAGARCEYEYNECESSPCANGGTCTDRVGGFQCACGRGYTGRTCQLKVDLCSPNPCPAHRFCIDRGNSYACECPRGYLGDECNMLAKTACDNNPCANGGTCWNGVDSFYCACRPGYTGKLCEEDFILESVMAGEDSTVPEIEEHVGSGSVREVRLPLGLYHDRLHNVYIAAGTLGAAIAIVGIVVTACHCRVNKTYARIMSRMSRVTETGPAHHWLQDKRAPAQHTAPLTQHATHAPYPVAQLDTADMYYTLDFSDSQHSPLIQ